MDCETRKANECDVGTLDLKGKHKGLTESVRRRTAQQKMDQRLSGLAIYCAGLPWVLRYDWCSLSDIRHSSSQRHGFVPILDAERFCEFRPRTYEGFISLEGSAPRFRISSVSSFSFSWNNSL